jgi:flagellar motor protein MotB
MTARRLVRQGWPRPLAWAALALLAVAETAQPAEVITSGAPAPGTERHESPEAPRRTWQTDTAPDEVGEKTVEQEVVVAGQINRVKVCRVETVCKLRYKEGHARRARIRNMVAPLHVDDEAGTVPPAFHRNIRQALADLAGKGNVVVRFTGFTDDAPLSGREERIYGTPLGLSKARARRAALAVQDALGLPAAAIEVDGKGAAQPIASNDSDKGRALNRRVEVEFWYDDPLQELGDEPQLCPEAAGAETVTRVYVPPSGGWRPILFEGGRPVIEPGTAQHLRNAMADIRDKANVRLRFTGYTRNERLDRRTAMVYGDDIGLSSARARRAMEALQREPGLENARAEFEGRGYVQSADVVNTGFVESEVSRVEVEVVYDELVALDEQDGLDITRFTREVEPKDPLALNTMRITVDGRPLDDPNKGLADIQRCTDAALSQARIRLKFDNLGVKPRLNVSAWPASVRYRDDPGTEWPDNLVRFRAYSNYPAAITRAEVRLFEAGQSERDTPLAVVAIGAGGEAEWQAEFAAHTAPARELKYLLRVYDRDGHFDETRAQPLWLVDALGADTGGEADAELRVGYGENRLAVENIRKRGGTVKVLGSGVPDGHAVWIAGRPVPVASDGKFVAEEILPPGLHTVEVAVLDSAGNGQLYLRDLELRRSEWFYVGIADLTVARDDTEGPARLVTQNETRYNNELSTEGRLAFYTNGKFGDGWSLTASADTLEGPASELFSNFLDKQPGALFRRIDPDYYYPTYGDDGTVEEGAPTLGKFYLRLRKDESYGLWGNFKISYADNELAQVNRGLYGANLHYATPGTTGFGEKRFVLDGFAADPGTIAARDEFLGTGGSLYYLRQQDVLTGSERVRIETRDKDSGVVIAVKNLAAVLDYTIDYLQGRVVLTQPLAPVAADGLLVTSDTLGGNPAYLVVDYEYSPGVTDLKAMATGGRSHVWLGDHVKLGVTASDNDHSSQNGSLQAADVTVRKSADTWIKLARGRSSGPGQQTLASNDGGFNFTTVGQPAGAEVSAGADRVDASLAFGDVVDGAGGRLTLYNQNVDAGYSAPGQIALTDTRQLGGTLRTPLAERLSLNGKFDQVEREQGLNTSAAEVDLGYRLNDHWGISTGVRRDRRADTSPVVPLTQVTGDRTDAALRATYDSRGRWLAYGYAQDTVATSGNRGENGRVGTGGSVQVSERLKVNGEVSGGDLGGAGRLGTEYLYTDRTSLYLTYLLDNESADTGVRSRKGNLVSGMRTRYSDTTSMYVEEKYTHGDVPTGLTHAAGVDVAPSDRWNFGAGADAGTLRDPRTGATLERRGVGVRVGYGAETVKLASAIEYRSDSSQQADLSIAGRETWLFKNGLKYQLTPSWRLVGKLNHAFSESSLGASYDGRYTEAAIGYGYRPVDNDRLNSLFKYTYFYNLPGGAQQAGAGAAADYIQKSHVLSLDAVYDLTHEWTLGAKYAYRLGQVSLERQDPQFFESNAHLYVLRADWEFVRHWEAMVEARMLDVVTAGDRRRGFLTAVYRHLGDHVKAGMGYNFTDFSDDLTNLSYRSHGLFINIVGKL